MKLLISVPFTAFCFLFFQASAYNSSFPDESFGSAFSYEEKAAAKNDDFSSFSGPLLATEVSDTCLNLDLGPDAKVCLGAKFTLNENPIPGQYQWFGGQGLSCTDCPSPTFTATNVGSYILGCIVTTPMCSDTDYITINIASGFQPIITILPDTAICIGAVIALGGAAFPTATYFWTSNPPGFSSMAAAPPPFSPAVSTTYFVSVTSATCIYPLRDSVVVSVYQPPVLSLISGASLCLGDSVVLGNTVVQPDVMYSWSPDNGSLNDIHLANPVATPQTVGVTLYQVVASNPGCTVISNVPVVVADITLNLSVPDTIAICRGSSRTISVAVSPIGTVVTWSPIQNLQLSPNGLTGIVSPMVDFTYSIKATSAGCSRTKMVFVHVDSLPQNLNVTPADTSVCGNTEILLSGPLFEPSDFPDISFKWTPAIGQITADSLPFLLVQPLVTTTYQRIANNGVCFDTAYATVTVIEPPNLSVSPVVSSICIGNSVNLMALAPGIDSLAWSPTTFLSCNGCLNPTATPTDTITYTLSGVFMGCPVAASATVNVIPLPKYQFPPSGDKCAGEVLQLNLINDPSITSYSWTASPASVIPPVAQPTVMLSGTGGQSITYYLEVNNGCVKRDSFKIQVIGVTLTVSGADTICPQTNKLLTAMASSSGGQFSWSNGATTQATNVAPLQTTTYTVTYLFNGCTFQDSVQVVVKGQIPAILFPSDVELCPGDSIILNSVATPGATYSWTSNVGGFTSQSAIPPPQVPGETTIYTVTATGADGCSVTKILDVTVFKATLSVSDDIMVCAGVPFTVSGVGSATGQYVWMPGAIMTPSFKDTLYAEQTTQYTLQYDYGTIGNACYLYDTVMVKVLRNFSVSIVADPDSVFNAGDELMLDAIVAPSQILNGFSFNWLENSTTTVGNTEQITVAPMTTDTSIRYTVVVVSPNGCSQTVSVRFRVLQPVVEIPNAFTPNGDGANDVFRLTLVEGKVAVERLAVFNRWGKKIYESMEPDAGWDGNFEGNAAPSDVYIYQYRWRRSDGSLVLENGEVTLLR